MGFFLGGALCGIWDLSPHQGLYLRPLHWKCGVPTSGLPGKSQENKTFLIDLTLTFVKLKSQNYCAKEHLIL